MTEDTRVVSSLEEEDMKSYLHEVLVEVGRMKKNIMRKMKTELQKID